MKSNKDHKRLCIIIPVLNEEDFISKTLTYLQEQSTEITLEIIVVDGGSTDNTVELAKRAGVSVFSAQPGRAAQMNFGAGMATGDIFYFLHIDTIPPSNFENAILNAVGNDYPAGCFRMRFDSNSKFLNFFAWFSQVNHRLCRGGDQSLFITRELFERTGGFDEAFKVYEDTEFVCRIYKTGRFKVLSDTVITSARRYDDKGNFKLQFHFGMIHLKRMLGAGPEQLYEYYQRHISE